VKTTKNDGGRMPRGLQYLKMTKTAKGRMSPMAADRIVSAWLFASRLLWQQLYEPV